MVENDRKMWNEVDGFFRERDILGFAGKIESEPIDEYFLFSQKHESSYQVFNKTLVIKGINPIAIGLLPLDTEITLNHYTTKTKRNKNVKTKIKNIKALTYLLRNSGFSEFVSYHISFKADSDCYAKFNNFVLIIRHSDKTLLNNLIEKYKLLRQEVS